MQRCVCRLTVQGLRELADKLETLGDGWKIDFVSRDQDRLTVELTKQAVKLDSGVTVTEWPYK